MTSNDFNIILWQSIKDNFEINSGDTMMIEADVNLGYFTGSSSLVMQPIMAHPPMIFSDLSLNLFLDTLIQVRFNRSTLDS